MGALASLCGSIAAQPDSDCGSRYDRADRGYRLPQRTVTRIAGLARERDVRCLPDRTGEPSWFARLGVQQ
jgi:hypothetical protein